jgi:hypothetical protein
MRRIALLLPLMAIFAGFSATWFCHSDFGDDAWTGAQIDSAKASFGGAIAVADSGDTIFACGRNFDEQVFTLTPLTIRAWPDSARWKLTYDSSGYAMEGYLRVSDGVIEGMNALRFYNGINYFAESCSLITTGGGLSYYMLYIYLGISCSLFNVQTEGSSTHIIFNYKNPYLFLGEGCEFNRSAVNTTYGLQWSSQNTLMKLRTQPSGNTLRKRYWESSTLNAVWFKP